MTIAEATAHADEMLALHRDVAGLRTSLRDKDAAMSALQRDNERLSKALRLCQREAERHRLAVEAAVREVLR
jgi:hypothetical protein